LALHNLTSYTCTNLVIRLRLMLRALGPGGVIECIVLRDQADAIRGLFPNGGYSVETRREAQNLYHVLIRKEPCGET
jgi:hypothetical protein